MLVQILFLVFTFRGGFSSIHPDEITCKPPPIPDKGYYTPTHVEVFLLLDRVWYECEEGYTLIGAQDFTCQLNGDWAPEEFPKCVACPIPHIPENGDLEPRKLNYQVREPIQFTCKNGFELVGEKFAECLSTGVWTNDEPTCAPILIQCERPNNPINGNISPSDVFHFNPNDQIIFECQDEYSLVGDSRFHCRKDGNWNSEDFPTCIACTQPLTPINGHLTPVQTLYKVGMQVQFGCNGGFELQGVDLIQCMDSGEFSDPSPQCVKIANQCERPDDPENGSINPSNIRLFDVRQQISFNCQPQYSLVGTKTFKCENDGNWNSLDFPLCVACPQPDAPFDGNMKPIQSLYKVGQKVQFTCNDGFELQGENFIQCLDSGEFSNFSPQCTPKKLDPNCRVPNEPRNGYIHPRKVKTFKPGQKLWFKCDRGYKLTGSVHDFRCLSNGNWDSNKFPGCKQHTVENRKCGVPNEPRNGYIHPRKVKTFKPGQKLWFKCDRGYKLTGSVHDFRCLSNGNWDSNKFPECKRHTVEKKSCPRPKSPRKGYIHPQKLKTFKPGQKLWFKCRRGYKLTGSKHDFKCLDNGKWDSEKFPKCERESKRKPKAKYLVVCEGKQVNLKCPRGKRIKVLKGFYGRDNSRTCSSSRIRGKKCIAKNSDRTLKKYCDRKSSCIIKSSNEVFGDPCKGKRKYVKLALQCV